METKIHPYKSNYLSSSDLKFKGLNNLNTEIDSEYKENMEKALNSSPCKKYAESSKQTNIHLSLLNFMENQNKKHLSTKYTHKDVEHFLKEKNKALEEIVIDENLSENKDTDENIENNNKSNMCNEKNLKNEEKKNNQYDNKNSHLLIFHGTFGNDEYEKIINQKDHHHHHNHHHHHHHHHHHDLKKQILSENIKNNINEKINKNFF